MRISTPIRPCGTFMFVFALLLVLSACSVNVKNADNGDNKDVDIKTPLGGIHVGEDADVRDTGLPVYPGARRRESDDNSKSVNLGIVSGAFGLKVVVVSYDSDDTPAKLTSYYKEQLKKYGNVLECHTREAVNDVDVNVDMSGKDKDKDKDGDSSSGSHALKCSNDDSGKTLELKAGNKENQHLVAIQPADSGKGTTFALVYVHTRGKQGEI